ERRLLRREEVVELRPARGGVAQIRALYRGLGDCASREILARGRAFGAEQALVIELRHEAIQFAVDLEPILRGLRLGLAPSRTELGRQLDAVFRREYPDRLGKGDGLDLLHERDHVAALLAAEAVIDLPLVGDGKRRRALGVERAKAHVVRA